MERIKVLFLTSCTGRGGSGNSLFYLLKHIDRSRIEPVVVMPKPGVIGKRLSAEGVRCLVFPRLKERLYEMRYEKSNLLTRTLSLIQNSIDCCFFVFQLVRLISRERAGLVHCNQMMVKLMGAAAGLLSGTPVVWHCRTIYSTFLQKVGFNLVARLSVVRKVIAVSRAAAANYPGHSEKVVVIHNGVDLDHFSRVQGNGALRNASGVGTDAAPTIGFMGRIVRWKGIDRLLDAAELILAAGQRPNFVIMGENAKNPSEDLLQIYRDDVRHRQLSELVVFTGFQKDVRPVLREVDLVVVPSIKPDPCPRSVIESLALGVPVVGSDTGGIPELVIDGSTGLLARAGDASDLAEKILLLLNSKSCRERMGRAARAWVAEHHDASQVARRIQKVLIASASHVETSIGTH